MMAAAMEGMGVYEFSKHVVPHLDDLPDAVGDVLSRVNLPALPGAGSLAAAPEASPAALVAEPEQAVAPDVAGNGAAAPVAPPPADGAEEPPPAAPAPSKEPAPDERSPRAAGESSPPPVAPELASLADSDAPGKRGPVDEPSAA